MAHRHPAPTSTYELIDRDLGPALDAAGQPVEPLADWLVRHHRAGTSLATMSRDIYNMTGRTITGEALRRWIGRLEPAPDTGGAATLQSA